MEIYLKKKGKVYVENKKTGSGSTALYNIEPIGIGTKSVESFTSYLMRTAYEHNITLGNLFNKLIIPQLKKGYLTRSSLYGGNRLYEGAKTINGFLENSYDLVKVMETLTGRNDLVNLTLFNLKEFIPVRNLLKESLSWCPKCISKWKRTREVLHYPLIWHIQPVTVCIEHKCLLESECSACNKKVDILRRESITGFCSNCFAPLDNSQLSEISDVELELQKFFLKNIEDLMTLNKLEILNGNYTCGLADSLSSIKENSFSGNLTRFSKFLNVPKTTLRYWINGVNKPPLESLLTICFKLNIKILDLLFEYDSLGVRIFQINDSLATNTKKIIRKPMDYSIVESKLVEILTNEVPISMSKSAEIVGHDRRVLYRNFNEYCKQISQRYSDFIKEKSSQRIDLLKTEINIAFNTLLTDGVYPSRRKMEQVINKSGLLKERVLQDYWKTLLTKNGFEE
nr:TniQ family protein [Bacillus sp. ISL-41]